MSTWGRVRFENVYLCVFNQPDPASALLYPSDPKHQIKEHANKPDNWIDWLKGDSRSFLAKVLKTTEQQAANTAIHVGSRLDSKWCAMWSNKSHQFRDGFALNYSSVYKNDINVTNQPELSRICVRNASWSWRVKRAAASAHVKHVKGSRWVLSVGWWVLGSFFRHQALQPSLESLQSKFLQPVPRLFVPAKPGIWLKEMGVEINFGAAWLLF